MIYSAILISLIFLLWNVLSENSVVKYLETRDTKYWKKWHLYDAILRTILIPYVVITVPDVTFLIKCKTLFTLGVIYHIGFNLGFNYVRFKDKFRNATLKGKLAILLTLATTVSSIDIAIGKLSIWITKIIKREINYRVIWGIIIIIELTLATIIWL